MIKEMHYGEHYMKRDLYETPLTKKLVNTVFQNATNARNNPSLMGKLLGKKKIDINDLQQAWKEAGYPTDSDDIENILNQVGFSDKEIKKTIDKVFDEEEFEPEEDENEPISPAIQKLADYAKKNGLAQDLIEFMKTNYNFTESKQHRGPFLFDDIRKIFTHIVNEERLDREHLIKLRDKNNLGRYKK